MRNKILILFLLVGFTVFSQVKIKINDTASPGSTDDQVLTLVGNTLSLEDGGSSIDLSGYLDNNEVVSGVVSGNNLTLTMSDASTIVIDVSSLVGGGGGVSVPVEEEGSQITAAVTKFNFTGTGVTATNVGDDVTVNVPGAGASSNNPNIVIATDQAEVTAAGAGATVSIIDPFTLTADYAPPNNQHWIIATTASIDLDVYSITNDVTITLPPKGFLALDYFDSDQKINHGTVSIEITNDKMYASNFGAIDDNLNTTDNFNVGNNMLWLVNQNSGHLVWDKQDTGFYWADLTGPGVPYDEGVGPFVAGVSPFYPNNTNPNWAVGNGYDHVTVEHEGEVELVSITNDKQTTRRYLFYDTFGSVIKGGTLRGDRYRHQYLRFITFTSGATSNGNIVIDWDEVDLFNSGAELQNYAPSIPITIGTPQQNAQEVVDYINTNLSGNGYVAYRDDDTVAWYKEGQDFEGNSPTDPVDEGTTGATTTYLQSPYEWGHAVGFGSNANFCELRSIRIYEFHGDAFTTDSQGNGTTALLDENFSTGFINDAGTIDGGNADYRYLTTIRDMPSPHDWFTLINVPTVGAKLLHFKYWMLFYDENDNFILKSKPLIPFEQYYPRVFKDGRPEIARYRVMVEYPGATDWADFAWFINSTSDSRGAIIEDCDIGWTRRQGISNPPIDFVIRNNYIHDTGGQQPQYGIDIEDYGKRNRGGIIEGNEFWNNAQGDIIIKGATNITIRNNFFRQDSWSMLSLGSDDDGNAIETAYARFTTIEGNHFEHKEVNFDIGTIVKGNHFYYGEINMKPGGSLLDGNIMVNCTLNGGVTIGEPTSQGTGGSQLTTVSNNVFKFSDDWGNKRLIDDDNTMIRKNNTWFFNDRGVEHNSLTDPSLGLVYNTSNVWNWIDANRSTADSTDPEHQAWISGENVTGLLVAPQFQHNNGWTYYSANVKDFHIEYPVIFQHGLEKSFNVKDGFCYRLEFDLNGFDSDGVGTFETITVQDVTVRVPDQIDANEGWLNNSNYGGNELANMIRVQEDRNVNLVFKDCTFDYGTNPAGLFMYLGHRGFTKFINCTFTADASQVINFTSSGSDDTTGVYVGPNTGDIDIINPTKTNVSFTLRGGDTETAW